MTAGQVTPGGAHSRSGARTRRRPILYRERRFARRTRRRTPAARHGREPRMLRDASELRMRPAAAAVRARTRFICRSRMARTVTISTTRALRPHAEGREIVRVLRPVEHSRCSRPQVRARPSHLPSLSSAPRRAVLAGSRRPLRVPLPRRLDPRLRRPWLTEEAAGGRSPSQGPPPSCSGRRTLAANHVGDRGKIHPRPLRCRLRGPGMVGEFPTAA